MVRKLTYSLLILFLFLACTKKVEEKTIKVWLIGDSTVADYANDYDDGDYMKDRYPITGWGQVFQPLVSGDNLKQLYHLMHADNAIVDNQARGGRSTRTFFQEGRWRVVYDQMQPEDFVLIQFGHNDASQEKHERYVNTEGYMEFLRLFIQQSKEKGATPVLITPVARNYPWVDGHLQNVHGDYPSSMQEVARETGTLLIDLYELSMNFFSEKGRDYVTSNYFMNLPPGKYQAYPDGQNDNTHFQTEGAKEVAELVYSGLIKLAQENTKKE